jgi:hypothetical protein
LRGVSAEYRSDNLRLLIVARSTHSSGQPAGKVALRLQNEKFVSGRAFSGKTPVRLCFEKGAPVAPAPLSHPESIPALPADGVYDPGKSFFGTSLGVPRRKSKMLGEKLKREPDTLAPHSTDAHARSSTRAGLVSYEVREKVGQNSKQRESRNAVSRKNPSSAAFMVPDSGSRRRTGIIRSNDWGPIFHAKCLRRKDRGAITLCVTPAPASWRGQDYLSGILPRIGAGGLEKCNPGTYCHEYKLSCNENSLSLSINVSVRSSIARPLTTIRPFAARPSSSSDQDAPSTPTWDNS